MIYRIANLPIDIKYKIIESLFISRSIAATTAGGSFADVLIGYAIKKVIKLLSVIIRLFFAGLAYLQYQQIADINRNKLQQVS
ncbi:MAG TPA: FUN14 domain-containing protein [Nitrososphaeraceae archaeon]|jgi:uncharacterized membrane protein (Fun14 family)|nr:FUN14 domain-containing protein [Nitrososphaeraceae archaeon]